MIEIETDTGTDTNTGKHSGTHIYIYIFTAAPQRGARDDSPSATGRLAANHTCAAHIRDDAHSATGRRDTESNECCSGSRSFTQCNWEEGY